MPNGLIDQTTLLLKKSLELRMRNQNVIASNIANAQTPGYEAKHFEFETDLRRAVENRSSGMVVTNPRHIAGNGISLESVKGKLTTIKDKSALGDGNTVDVDQEMVTMAQNQIMFEASTQMLNKKLAIMKYVIQGQ